jgi:hypothetical protein
MLPKADHLQEVQENEKVHTGSRTYTRIHVKVLVPLYLCSKL